MERFGQQTPIVADSDGIIIKGNATVEAARSLGWDSVDVVRTELAGAEQRAYAIADNRSGELAEWDDPGLAEALKDLGAAGIGLESLGFTSDDLAELEAAGPTEIVEDDVPAVQEACITRPGDLWLLGDHRVLCGDSTKAEDVGRVMGGAQANVMVSDPPYGIEHDSTWRDDAGLNTMGPTAAKGITWDADADWRLAIELFKGDVLYCWHSGLKANVVVAALAACGFSVRAQIVWVKDVAPFGRGDYHWQHEPCYYAVRDGKPANILDRDVTVWSAPSPKHIMSASKDDKTPHPTQKPIEIMARSIRRHRGAVYDPFLGSGTTLIAAEQLKRRCYGLEIEPRYCDVICRRWERLTGRDPVRESDGAKFGELTNG